MAVEKYVEDEEMFLANYSDGLTDLDLTEMIGRSDGERQGRHLPGASPPSQSFHLVDLDAGGKVACAAAGQRDPTC